ncbi:thioesterase family protein [Nocardioides caeni]|uniref:Thioesterase family protein n=1 Tax=Nocardioides caeni TaxID=574700 RepID=A0A4S8N431_9ACTN|nr:thioesterase family protein [Nocardioides caeni]THV10817.1 thioesterase family protein [Nocardioides caeni]
MSAATEFDRHIDVSPLGDGRFAVELDAGWAVGAGLNGGYQLSVVGNAIRAAFPQQPDPIVVSAYYLGPAQAGPATVEVTPRRAGRTVTVGADLRQGEDVRLTVLATYGDLAAQPDAVATTAEPLVLPPREECRPNSEAPAAIRTLAPLIDRFEMLFHPDQAGWFGGEPTGRGEISAWFRLKDGRQPDPIALLTVLDALPPVTFELGRPGWAPTIELTAHVRALPAPGWLRVRHVTRNIAGDMFEEDCEVWDSADRLVAQSRQLARLPR